MNIIKYIDCDGVILNTEEHLFDEYNKLKLIYPNLKKKQYLEEMDWEEYLNQAGIINDSLDILKNYDPKNVIILTKVHSLKEAKAKIDYFRRNKIINNIIIVPDEIAKNKIVIAKDNILVDDNINNLNDWNNDNGLSIYFGKKDSIYPKISSLYDVLNPKKLKLLR